jgi:hypothetical protein
MPSNMLRKVAMVVINTPNGLNVIRRKRLTQGTY